MLKSDEKIDNFTLSSTESMSFTEIIESFDEDVQCEHSEHNKPHRAYAHNGPGAWKVEIVCLECDGVSSYVACDRFLRTVLQSRDPRISVRCSFKSNGTGCGIVSRMSHPKFKLNARKL